MILHDVVTMTWTEKLDSLSGGTPRSVVAGQIPCEINPIETEPPTDSSPVKIRYRFVTTVDLTVLADEALANFIATKPDGRQITGIRLTLTYDGKTISPEAGFERHKILGRFHHIEAVMKDFGFTGS